MSQLHPPHEDLMELLEQLSADLRSLELIMHSDDETLNYGSDKQHRIMEIGSLLMYVRSLIQ